MFIRFVSLKVLSDALSGDVIALIVVPFSNGIFTGSFSFILPNLDASGMITTGGNFVNGYTLVLARDLSTGDIGDHTISIEAVQGIDTVSTNYTFNVPT